MMPDRWIRITALRELPLREGRLVQIGDREIALFNLGDAVFAADNRCPHRGGPLCDGMVAGRAVVCPLHAWKVNLESGEIERPAAANQCVQTYATRIHDGAVEIALRHEPEPAGAIRLPVERRLA